MKKGKRIPWNKGLHIKLNNALDKFRASGGAAMRGRKFSAEHIIKLKDSHLGKKLSLETRKKMSESRKGSGNPSWKGGITKETASIRDSLRYKLWREQVFSRDDYTCQKCGARSGVGKPVKLQADHITPFSVIYEEFKIGTCTLDALFDLENGRTLCIECHKKTRTYLSGGRYSVELRMIKSLRDSWKKDCKGQDFKEYYERFMRYLFTKVYEIAEEAQKEN